MQEINNQDNTTDNNQSFIISVCIFCFFLPCIFYNYIKDWFISTTPNDQPSTSKDIQNNDQIIKEKLSVDTVDSARNIFREQSPSANSQSNEEIKDDSKGVLIKTGDGTLVLSSVNVYLSELNKKDEKVYSGQLYVSFNESSSNQTKNDVDKADQEIALENQFATLTLDNTTSDIAINNGADPSINGTIIIDPNNLGEENGELSILDNSLLESNVEQNFMGVILSNLHDEQTK